LTLAEELNKVVMEAVYSSGGQLSPDCIVLHPRREKFLVLVIPSQTKCMVRIKSSVLVIYGVFKGCYDQSKFEQFCAQ
jgi:hypothetical protein